MKEGEMHWEKKRNLALLGIARGSGEDRAGGHQAEAYEETKGWTAEHWAEAYEKAKDWTAGHWAKAYEKGKGRAGGHQAEACNKAPHW